MKAYLTFRTVPFALPGAIMHFERQQTLLKQSKLCISIGLTFNHSQVEKKKRKGTHHKEESKRQLRYSFVLFAAFADSRAILDIVTQCRLHSRLETSYCINRLSRYLLSSLSSPRHHSTNTSHFQLHFQSSRSFSIRRVHLRSRDLSPKLTQAGTIVAPATT